jgi:hypothetical protein
VGGRADAEKGAGLEQDPEVGSYTDQMGITGTASWRKGHLN